MSWLICQPGEGWVDFSPNGSTRGYYRRGDAGCVGALSSRRGRADICVGVAYGTDPQRVITLLLVVAAAHPAVSHNPKPEAYFLGFGKSALNFELCFWSDLEARFQLKSEVAVRLVKTLQAANIETPFPHRDLHIRSRDFAAAVPASKSGPTFASAARATGAEGARERTSEVQLKR